MPFVSNVMQMSRRRSADNWDADRIMSGYSVSTSLQGLTKKTSAIETYKAARSHSLTNLPSPASPSHAIPPMIDFQSLPRDEMEAMCTPLHLILPPPTTTAARDPAAAPGPSSSGGGALYLGSMAAVLEPDTLRAHGITHIVQALETPWAPQPEIDASASDAVPGGSGRTKFVYHRIDIEDDASAPLQPHLEDACDWIRDSLEVGNVLVHCQQGVSRSPSLVIAYCIRERHMSYDEAFAAVKKARRCIKPNAGFVRTLREWEGTCRGVEKEQINRKATERRRDAVAESRHDERTASGTASSTQTLSPHTS
ncbi:unnamed protein product [Mycena citricolor]|uniref:protein-tyrosine-phosphatase n=1 Tax=Mycena citricolor TaxID=2018698 RepID=A0AAD2JY95_9AGAR|nr:unnamed protein product [Mycena citricolor]